MNKLFNGDLVLCSIEHTIRQGIQDPHTRSLCLSALHKAFKDYRNLLSSYEQAHIPSDLTQYQPIPEGAYVAAQSPGDADVVLVLNRIHHLHRVCLHSDVKNIKTDKRDRFDHEAARIERHLQVVYSRGAIGRKTDAVALVLNALFSESLASFRLTPRDRGLDPGLVPNIAYTYNDTSLPLAEVLRRIDEERARGHKAASCDACTNACEGGSCK